MPVKSDLSWEEFAKVNQYAPELPGVMADMNEARFYPFGGSFAHVIGYVAKVTDRDIKAITDKGEEPPQILYNPGFRIGRSGVEKALDADLRGEAGGHPGSRWTRAVGSLRPTSGARVRRSTARTLS